LKKKPKYIAISRTDSIGDVVLTLPMAKVLKDNFPETRIGFIGKDYTKDVIDACKYIDNFIDVKDFLNDTIKTDLPDAIIHVFPVKAIAVKAKELKIKLRVGTKNRFYHWFTCNNLIKLGRKNSLLHEAQLNLELLKAFDIKTHFSLDEIGKSFGLQKIKPLQPHFLSLIKKDKYNLILHPKSQGSAREWGLPNFITLINSLDAERYNILISGTKKERILLQPLFDDVADKVTDTTGLMNLQEFIAFIANCDGLVANSTGPLHIAATLGKNAFGIYPPIRPMHPGRWKPLGSKTKVFVLNKECNDCREENTFCHCMQQVSPMLIKKELDNINQ
jgi:ADP-heptose:LPS heptosyltransferase